MMRKTWMALAAAALSLTAAQSAEPLSKAELYGLSPDAGARRILKLLGDLIILPDKYEGARPTRLLTEYSYALKPHGTSVPGLCESETIDFRFEPLRLEESSDTPTRLSDVQVSGRRYHFREIHELSNQDMSKSERALLNAHCRNEDPQRFFWADSAEQVVEGVWLLKAVKAQASPANPEHLINCPSDGRDECAKQFGDLAVERISGVESCARDQERASSNCLMLSSVGANALQVHYTGHGQKIRITRIAFYEIVTTGDYRVE